LESGVDRLLWEVENSLSQRYESVLEEKWAKQKHWWKIRYVQSYFLSVSDNVHPIMFQICNRGVSLNDKLHNYNPWLVRITLVQSSSFTFFSLIQENWNKCNCSNPFHMVHLLEFLV
jgi:hypothetical protein